MADSISQPQSNRDWIPVVAVQAAILAGILAVYYWPVLVRLVSIWSTDSNWSHGFIIPFFSLYYLYLQRDRMPLHLRGPSVPARLIGAGLIMAGFFLYYKGLMWQTGYPKDLSLLATIAGIVLLACGWPVARWGWFAVAFLIFALPAPVRLYEQLTMPLRAVAAQVSGYTLCFLPGMIAEPQGTVVEYIYGSRSGTLDIEQACSGMRLLMTMMALGVAMAFMNERPLWQRLVMILSCVPIAIFCNIIRVTTTGFMVVFDRDDLARGTAHTLLGMAMLMVAFGLYSLLSYVLSHLVVEGEDEPVHEGKLSTAEV